MTTRLPSHQPPPDDENPGPRRNGSMPVYGWLIIALSVIGIAVYLVVDHWPHLLAALPYLGIIAVAGLHMFGHRGHGGGHGGGGHGHRDTSHGGAGPVDPP